MRIRRVIRVTVESSPGSKALDRWPRGGPDLAGVGKEDWHAMAGPTLASSLPLLARARPASLLMLTWPRAGIVRGQ
jgi:hypothetical protein